jgi:hypothetical protein
MRAGLVAAAETAPNSMVGYEKGATVLCQNCFVPLFKLERGLHPGEGVKAEAFRPISRIELRQLRREVTSINAALKLWTDEDEKAHVNSIDRPVQGSPALCPKCGQGFPQVFAVEAAEVNNRDYTWRLITVPPMSEAYPMRSSHVDL